MNKNIQFNNNNVEQQKVFDSVAITNTSIIYTTFAYEIKFNFNF